MLLDQADELTFSAIAAPFNNAVKKESVVFCHGYPIRLGGLLMPNSY